MKRLLGIALMIVACPISVFAQSGAKTLTLKEALSVALSSGPDIQVAQLTLSTAGAQLKGAEAQNGLSLGASSAYSHQDKIGTPTGTVSGSSSIPASSLPGESVNGSVSLIGPSTKASVQASYGIADNVGATNNRSQVSSVGVSVNQTLYDGYPGGRAKASLQQAQDTYRIAQVNYDSAKENVIFTVEQSYFTVLGDQHTVQLRKEQLKQSQQDLARTNAFFQANRVTKLDILTSQVVEQTAQANLVSAENALKQDRSSLAVLLGWPIDREFSVAEVNEPSPPGLSEQQAVGKALENRAEIRQYEINIAKTKVGMKSAESQRLPTVALTGGASYNIYPGVSPSPNAGTWNAGVSVSLPIFDSGAVSAQVAQAQHTLNQLDIQEQQAKQNITIDVRKTLFAVKDASVRLNLAEESVKQAQGEYELQKTKFQAGLSSNLDVIDASVTLANAQVSLETAKTNLNLAVLNLEKAMGTLSANNP